jgi:hypothetical protein
VGTHSGLLRSSERYRELLASADAAGQDHGRGGAAARAQTLGGASSAGRSAGA